ncbi:serine/threonine-protein kinase PAK 4-like [Erinaceus europaeus]|uniref:Serine/threonine-protein kinase PAK 4-like n=1 Tax=Erinaceus europaeus TaxID=9365 RepID=A0ABM3YBE0_ERIEU|nr:serine/threonine-protein kinase PAK 4-like [Erinaceus europaeus]
MTREWCLWAKGLSIQDEAEESDSCCRHPRKAGACLQRLSEEEEEEETTSFDLPRALFLSPALHPALAERAGAEGGERGRDEGGRGEGALARSPEPRAATERGSPPNSRAAAQPAPGAAAASGTGAGAPVGAAPGTPERGGRGAPHSRAPRSPAAAAWGRPRLAPHCSSPPGPAAGADEPMARGPSAAAPAAPPAPPAPGTMRAAPGPRGCTCLLLAAVLDLVRGCTVQERATS